MMRRARAAFYAYCLREGFRTTRPSRAQVQITAVWWLVTAMLTVIAMLLQRDPTGITATPFAFLGAMVAESLGIAHLFADIVSEDDIE